MLGDFSLHFFRNVSLKKRDHALRCYLLPKKGKRIFAKIVRPFVLRCCGSVLILVPQKTLLH